MAIYHKFSFDFGDPFVEVFGYRFGFRIFSPTNTYGFPDATLGLSTEQGSQVLRAEGLTWAGGQETAAGDLEARFEGSKAGFKWTVRAWAPEPIKAIATLVDGVPRGRIAHYDSPYRDPGEEEHLFFYPHSGRRYGTSISSPLLIIAPPDGPLLSTRSLDREVRPKRFYLAPSGAMEFIAEERARDWADDWTSPAWGMVRAKAAEEVYRAHQSHLEEAHGLLQWQQRTAVPDWLREIQLVLSLHGTHWTGYVFNSYAQMLELLGCLTNRTAPRVGVSAGVGRPLLLGLPSVPALLPNVRRRGIPSPPWERQEHGVPLHADVQHQLLQPT